MDDVQDARRERGGEAMNPIIAHLERTQGTEASVINQL